jgi:hypothetical protein
LIAPPNPFVVSFPRNLVLLTVSGPSMEIAPPSPITFPSHKKKKGRGAEAVQEEGAEAASLSFA